MVILADLDCFGQKKSHQNYTFKIFRSPAVYNSFVRAGGGWVGEGVISYFLQVAGSGAKRELGAEKMPLDARSHKHSTKIIRGLLRLLFLLLMLQLLLLFSMGKIQNSFRAILGKRCNL